MTKIAIIMTKIKVVRMTLRLSKVVNMNSASGLPAEIVFGIVIAVALWSVVLWIGFKK